MSLSSWRSWVFGGSARAARPARKRSGFTTYRPRLEALEDRWVPSAVRPGFDTIPTFHSDDGGVGPIPLSFSMNFFKTSYKEIFINNNGNVSFGANFFSYVPDPLSTISTPTASPARRRRDSRPQNSSK